jgi:bla regulator protein BlaR1
VTWSKLSKLELRILESRWANGKASIWEILETFPEPPPAYTTIQTTVYRLETKNAVRRVRKIVETIFWFYLLVWWIGARLIEGRERACDEQVLLLGNEAEVYAESILSVCQFCVESQLTCISSVTGSDVKRRIVEISRNHIDESLNGSKKFFLAAAAVAALFLPIVAGALTVPHPRLPFSLAQSLADTRDKPKFDAASIKQNKSGSRGTYMRKQPGGRLTAANMTLRVLIAVAYLDGLSPETSLVLGGPRWIDSERFDVETVTEGDPDIHQEHLMMQSLLEDRFKLVLHHEVRQLPSYALVVSKPGKIGPQLIPHASDVKCTDLGKPLPQPGPGEPMPAYCGGFFISPNAGSLRETGNGITIDKLSDHLNQFLHRKVVDRTGLSGEFDFTLEFAPNPTAITPEPSDVPSIFTALPEQLGLKLESTTGPVDVIVVDTVEEPTAN